MPAPTISNQMVRFLLQGLRRNDRQAVVLQLLEMGVWVSVTPDPLPLPDVAIVSSAALTITLGELQSMIQQQRTLSASVLNRDESGVAAIIERNAEMMESVVRALATLTPSSGFLMVEG